MSHTAIKCRRFDDVFAQYDEFFAYGPGAFWWGDHPGWSERTMFLVVPGHRGVCAIPVVPHGEGPPEWAGHTWSGHENFPTIRASILTPTWHGWMTTGVLTTLMWSAM